MIGAPLTPLELRLEVSKRLSNLRLELLKCLYDRHSIIERYSLGVIELHVHFALDGMHCARYRRVNPIEGLTGASKSRSGKFRLMIKGPSIVGA